MAGGADEAFALLESELWTRFDQRERTAAETIARLHSELETLRSQLAAREGELLRLQVRFERIQRSAPLRLYSRIKLLPGAREFAARRQRGFDAALRRRAGN